MAAILLSMWLPGMAQTTQAAIYVPAAPKVTGSSSANIVTLKWDTVKAAEGYEIFIYSADKQYHWFKYCSASQTKVSLTGKVNLTYRYRVRALRKVNGNKIYSPFTSVVVKTAPSPAPNITSTARDKADSGLVRYQCSSIADGFEIFRAPSADGTYKKVATVNNKDTHAIRDTGLASGSTYYYKVRSFVKNSGSVTYGKFGNVRTLPKYSASGSGGSSSGSSSSTGSNRKLLIVGDSRVQYMSNWYRNSRVTYIAKSGVGISWLKGTSILNQILSVLDGKTDIILWIGANDFDYYSQYLTFYKTAVPKWRAKGARVYIASLGPFLGGTDGYGGSDRDLERFNSYLKDHIKELGSGVTYLDVYSYLKSKGYTFVSGDRVHYSQTTTGVVFNYFYSLIK